jgi:hypothetical protein
MTRIIFVAFLFCLLFSCSLLQGDKGKSHADTVCDNFMQALAEGKIPAATQLLKQNSVIEPSAIDTLQQTAAQQMKTLVNAWGKVYSWEFVGEHKVKDVVAKRYYLLKFERSYLKFDFTLYNNGVNWTITNFEYNYDSADLFK